MNKIEVWKLKNPSLFTTVFSAKFHGCQFCIPKFILFSTFPRKNIHKSRNVIKKHWVREIYLTRQNDKDWRLEKNQRIWCSMTRARISTLIRALQLHQLSQTVEPVVMSFSLFETISFMRFEVAKANTSRNQCIWCSKENTMCFSCVFCFFELALL